MCTCGKFISMTFVIIFHIYIHCKIPHCGTNKGLLLLFSILIVVYTGYGSSPQWPCLKCFTTLMIPTVKLKSVNFNLTMMMHQDLWQIKFLKSWCIFYHELGSCCNFISKLHQIVWWEAWSHNHCATGTGNKSCVMMSCPRSDNQGRRAWPTLLTALITTKLISILFKSLWTSFFDMFAERLKSLFTWLSTCNFSFVPIHLSCMFLECGYPGKSHTVKGLKHHTDRRRAEIHSQHLLQWDLRPSLGHHHKESPSSSSSCSQCFLKMSSNHTAIQTQAECPHL